MGTYEEFKPEFEDVVPVKKGKKNKKEKEKDLVATTTVNNWMTSQVDNGYQYNPADFEDKPEEMVKTDQWEEVKQVKQVGK